MKKEKKYQLMWKKYCMRSGLVRINRKGFGRLGYCDVCEPKAPVWSHNENDGEHSWSTTSLLSLCKDFFPKKFDVDLYDYDASNDHEIGELKYMDSCDDGTQNREEKDRVERKVMKKYLEGFPKKARKKHMERFRDLQKKKSQVYLVDKYDFILRQLYLIKKGFEAASIENKVKTGGIAPADKKYLKITGSTLAVDICFAHALDITRGIRGRDVMIGMVEAGYADVGLKIPKATKLLY